MSTWRWIYGNGDERFYNVGILADGSLHNPNGYPEDLVRSAPAAAEERQRLRRSKAAQQAAVTRKRRREKRIMAAAERIRTRQGIAHRTHCYVCGKSLSDMASRQRGIGPECWQEILAMIERIKSGQQVAK